MFVLVVIVLIIDLVIAAAVVVVVVSVVAVDFLLQFQRALSPSPAEESELQNVLAHFIHCWARNR